METGSDLAGSGLSAASSNGTLVLSVVKELEMENISL